MTRGCTSLPQPRSFFDTMRTSDLRRLNQRFAQAFGRPNGTQPKYKWCRASELVRFVKSGSAEQKTEGGIWFVAPKYRRETWVARYGDVWLIGQWKAPEMSPERWVAIHGTSIPYPVNGRYLPIDGSQIPLGAEPTEDITQQAIYRLREQMEKTYLDFVNEGKELAEKGHAEAKQRWEDIVDDRWPAFDGVPGKKLHVSFPTPQTQIYKPQSKAE